MTPWTKPEQTEEFFCPFCGGNEDSTPKETFAVRPDKTKPDARGWSLRVVPNKFPALISKGEVIRSENGLFLSVSGVGEHEVLIETACHSESLADLPAERVADLFRAVKLRTLKFKSDKKNLCVQFFKNHGMAAGASLEHSHSQIIAMPVISKQLKEQLDGAKSRFKELGRCVYCEIMEAELKTGARVISENLDFVAIAPFAPRFAYETMILPKNHSARYEETSNDTLASLARIYKDISFRINSLLNNPPYNMTIHTAPLNNNQHDKSFHWHMEIWPVTTRVAGFEWGSGFHINSVSPEKAATAMREVQPL